MPTEIDFTVPADVWGDSLGPTLDHNAARAILLERLGFSGSIDSLTNTQNRAQARNTWKPLMDSILKMLPPEMVTEQALRQMDLRTLLQPILATEYQADKRGPIEINGQQFDENAQALAGRLFVDYRRKMREQLEQQLAESGVPVDEIPMFVDDMLNEWRDQPKGTLVPTNTVEGTLTLDPVTGAVQTVGGNENLNDLASIIQNIQSGGGPALESPGFLTPDDYKIMLSTDSPNAVIGRYYDDLSQRAGFQAAGGAAPADELRVPLGEFGPQDRTVSLTDVSQAGGPDVRPGTDRGYTLSEAMRLPIDSMTHAQVVSLTEKMRKAGIFAQTPGGEPTIKGDPVDPKFKAGYQLLLAKAIERGISVPTVLEEDSLAYDEAVAEKVRARLTDPASMRIAADTIARSQLGRKLNNKESAQYIEMIHGMQRDQAAAEMDEDGGDVTEVDWQARMQEMIREANAGEAGAHDVADQFDTFRGMLRGPGRGI